MATARTKIQVVQGSLIAGSIVVGIGRMLPLFRLKLSKNQPELNQLNIEEKSLYDPDKYNLRQIRRPTIAASVSRSVDQWTAALRKFCLERRVLIPGIRLKETDCLYRSMGVSRFVAFHDLDEFLIPQKPELLPQTAPLLALLNTVLVNNVASIRVPTQYMSLQDTGELITLKNTLQRSYTDKTLTKCVVRPEMIFEQGIHHTSRVIQDNYKAIAGDEDTLRLYHFKTRGGSKTDTRIVRDYGDRLTQRYREVVAQIGL
ncbi:hypothetical protein ANCCEY_02262 [Ancylostoma ceylanicum]|uniref:Glycosyltransferase family 92 protein n=1 Tax=Ancylostoma ceylanicum TaxID=53326 RepID=A0A0D6M3C3_9BILA|nr:hypothetical protein ANCCEY_02262 [Ancylostoma ceylanicum]